MSQFYAMPSGGYSINGAQGVNNINVINDYLSADGFSRESIIGTLGNIYGESALNPWLWENNTVDYSKGYGLLQFTPASEYINASGIPNHAPNLSTSQQTPGADPDDGLGQLYCLVHDTFGKWVSSCWRSYWSTTTYATLYTLRQHCLDTYGNGSSITLNQFKNVTNIDDAVFIFLACYEGPLVPNYAQRVAYANQIAQYVGGDQRGAIIGALKLLKFL